MNKQKTLEELFLEQVMMHTNGAINQEELVEHWKKYEYEMKPKIDSITYDQLNKIVAKKMKDARVATMSHKYEKVFHNVLCYTIDIEETEDYLIQIVWSECPTCVHVRERYVIGLYHTLHQAYQWDLVQLNEKE